MLLFFASASTGCEEPSRGSTLDAIMEGGELVVLTRNSPTTYYEGAHGYAGLEYELAMGFAEHLGVSARIKVLDSTAAIVSALARHRGHVAAAGLTPTELRRARLLFGPDYQTVREQVVCRNARPRNVAALSTVSLVVSAGTSYVETLSALRAEHASLEWHVTEEYGTEQLLESVWNGAFDCTVADSNIVAINRRYFPELLVMFDLTPPQSLAWAFPKSAARLREVAGQWFESIENSGDLERLRKKYYDFVRVFDYYDTRTFRQRIETRLPKYRRDFVRAARRHGFDWRLLAAQAYQESHWDPGSTSPTGVGGIMMLTQATAAELGVDDRRDPTQSIMGGASYLARLHAALAPEIIEPDRTWIALAAYNVGAGHIADARTLARQAGLDPNHWRSLAAVLPKLSNPKYYRTLRHGYARGSEPVRYVQRIRNYWDILGKSFQ